MSKYDKMRLKQNSLTASAYHNLGLVKKGATEIASDCRRVAEIYRTAPSILDDIDNQFLTLTHMDQTVISYGTLSKTISCQLLCCDCTTGKVLEKSLWSSRKAARCFFSICKIDLSLCDSLEPSILSSSVLLSSAKRNQRVI